MYNGCSLCSISASNSPVSHSKARFYINTAFWKCFSSCSEFKVCSFGFVFKVRKHFVAFRKYVLLGQLACVSAKLKTTTVRVLIDTAFTVSSDIAISTVAGGSN